MRGIAKERYHKSISTKLIFRISMVLWIAFFTLFCIMFIINWNFVTNKEKETAKAYESSTIVTIDDKLKDMCRVSLMSMANQQSLDILCGYKNMSIRDRMEAEKYLDEFYRSLVTIREDICGIYIVDEDSLIFNYDTYSASAKKSSDTAPIVKQIDEKEKEYFPIANCSVIGDELPSFMKYHKEITSNVDLNNNIWMVRDIYTFSPHEKVGTIILLAPVLTLKSLCEESISNNTEYLLISSTGKIVCSGQKEDILKNVNDQYPEVAEAITLDSPTYAEFRGEKYLISSVTSQTSGFRLVSAIPRRILLKESISFSKAYIVIFVLAIFMIAFFSAFVIKKFTSPIKYLAEEMENFRPENIGTRYPITTDDESGRLMSSFNRMMDIIENLIEKDYKSQVSIKEGKLREKNLEMKYLKSQINPHFLYNTLDTIRISAEINKDYNVAQMLMELVHFFRLSVKVDQPIVTIDHEIDLIQSYLKLIKMRYPELECEYDIDENILESDIPNFVLQPVVENSLLHGLRDKGYKGKITVRAHRYPNSENMIEITVEDDGIGFTENTWAQVRKLLSETEAENSNDKGIGIYNVQRRLKMFYPKNGGLSYSKRDDGGVAAHILIDNQINIK